MRLSCESVPIGVEGWLVGNDLRGIDRGEVRNSYHDGYLAQRYSVAELPVDESPTYTAGSSP